MSGATTSWTVYEPKLAASKHATTVFFKELRQVGTVRQDGLGYKGVVPDEAPIVDISYIKLRGIDAYQCHRWSVTPKLDRQCSHWRRTEAFQPVCPTLTMMLSAVPPTRPSVAWSFCSAEQEDGKHPFNVECEGWRRIWTVNSPILRESSDLDGSQARRIADPPSSGLTRQRVSFLRGFLRKSLQ